MEEKKNNEVGSGALRERIHEIGVKYGGDNPATVYLLERAIEDLLSLSSPIETETGVSVTDGVPSFYPKVVNQARPTSQASSEVREAHGIRLTAKGRELLEQVIEEERKENPEGVARIEAILALAPSRQGASQEKQK